MNFPGVRYSGNRVGPKWLSLNYSKREVMVPMRDGVKLYTAIYEPKEQGPHPVIMLRSPYPFNPYGKTFSDQLKKNLYMFARNSYIIVMQNVRGTYLSEGEFVNVRPYIPDKAPDQIDEATDTYDTAQFLVDNLSTNGSIGVKGISYPGFYATLAALSGHPSIKAVSPQAPVTDWWIGDDAHLNGAFQNAMYSFASSFMRPRKAPTIRWSPSIVEMEGDIYDYFLEREPLGDLLSPVVDRLPFLKELTLHPDYDAFWKERNPAYHLGGVNVPMLIVGGWFDAEDCYGTFETFRKVQELSPDCPAYLVSGPWYHGGWKNLEYDHLAEAYFGKDSAKSFLEDIEYPFFAYYLEGKGEKPDYKAVILPSGETMQKEMENHSVVDDWEKLSAWPVGTSSLRLYPSDDEKLSDAPYEDTSSFSYVSDPLHPVPYCAETTTKFSRDAHAANQKFASRRTDVLSFVGKKLKSPVSVYGQVKAHFSFSISTTDADIVFKVIDVRPDGYHMLVRQGVLPVRYRNGFEKGIPAVPGEKMEMDIILNDIAHKFCEGHRIMVQVQSSIFPLIAMNPQTFLPDQYVARASDYVKSEITIYGGAGGSWVDLPLK
ncbi:MAG: CocE/NonD family hydrolase [Bacteroidales bacterium]|nr:CocE/NonD family hydrolase [Bacteroidales bacterium]